MRISIKKYIVLLAALALTITSCSESFLNEVNPNKETPSTYWVDEGNIMKGLSAVYNPVRRMSWGYYGGYESVLHYQMRADDMYPTRGEEPSTWENLAFTNTPNTGNGLWGYLYVGIQYANEFIYNAPNVPNIDKTMLDNMMGEAYFLRGFWYFRLYTDFNEAVIRTLPANIDPSHRALSPAADVLAQAISDLKMAKDLLPSTRPSSEDGRVYKGAAIAMLGKAYIWQKDFTSAKSELNLIMNDYSLMDKYEDNFRDDTEFNKESIWEINFEAKGNTGDSWGSSQGANAFMGNVIGHYFGPNLKGDGATGSNKGGGWYKMQPSPYLMKQFVAERRPSGSDTKWDKRMYTTAFFKYSDYGDVKEDETFFDGFQFDDMFNWTTQPDNDDKYRIKSGIAPDFPVIEGKQGRFLWKKLTPWWNAGGCTMYSNDGGRITNFRIMRFAEVLFLHAEASLETNDNSGAMADINKIRVRAGLAEKNLTDKNEIMEELRNQKLLEFAGENVRWDDLVRWYPFDELKSVMLSRKTDTRVWEPSKNNEGEVTGYVPTDKVIDSQNFVNFQKKHLYFPIPQSEVDANLELEQKADWQ